MGLPGIAASTFRQIVKSTVTRGGREVDVYRRGGKFVSKQAYRSQQWRMRGGKAGTAARRAQSRDIERAMRAEWGAPPAGKSWQQIASKYPERFMDYFPEIFV